MLYYQVIGELLTSHVSSMTVEVYISSIYAVYSPKSPITKVRMIHLNPPASENEIQYFLYRFLCARVYRPLAITSTSGLISLATVAIRHLGGQANITTYLNTCKRNLFAAASEANRVHSELC